MTLHSHFLLKLCLAIGCGLNAGIFFAFSTFVMSALAQQRTASGIATMQSINNTAINPWFMTVLLGTGAACLFLAISCLLKWHQPGASLWAKYLATWTFWNYVRSCGYRQFNLTIAYSP